MAISFNTLNGFLEIVNNLLSQTHSKGSLPVMCPRPVKTKLSREFRDWVISLRQDRGLNQAQLALDADVTPGELSRFETGSRDASDDFLMKLARALGMDEGEMLTKAALDRVEQAKKPPEKRKPRPASSVESRFAGRSEAGEYPLTDDEMELIRDAEDLGNLPFSYLDEPELYDEPHDSEHRLWVFEKLAELNEGRRRWIASRKAKKEGA